MVDDDIEKGGGREVDDLVGCIESWREVERKCLGGRGQSILRVWRECYRVANS